VAVVGELMMNLPSIRKGTLEMGEGNSLQKKPLAAAAMRRIKQLLLLPVRTLRHSRKDRKGCEVIV
jgi:hypothetical protein